MASTPSLCPCGTGKQFDDCCNTFLTGGRYATTAEDLMRSRYSAFVMRNQEYLYNSWHPSTRPADIGFVNDQAWTGLTILSTTGGGMLDTAGTVEFVAAYNRAGVTGELHENSEFLRVDGKWLYVDDV